MPISIKLFYLAIALSCNNLCAQPIISFQNLDPGAPPINYPLNRIFNSYPLNRFFSKLQELKKNNNTVIRIVHIGDSHIQADFLSGFVRRNLQAYFGNAGRGLIFPYQLARSNSPADIKSKSSIVWEFNRVAHPEIPISPGVSGYVIQTNKVTADIEISLNDSENDSALYFKRVQFFIDSNENTSWILHAENNPGVYFINNDSTTSNTYHEVVLDNFTNKLSLTAMPVNNLKSFYGVSVENDNPGILYHAIGVNGARYGQFNNAPLFWQQVAALQADLYIISLGTNEAQQLVFNEKDFRQQVSLMLDHIKDINPDAAVLLTTAPDSFKGRAPNAILKQLNTTLTNYCYENKVPLWDLYRVTNGYGACYKWFAQGLMNKDRIHFTAEGYRLQGQLLFNALAKEYNEFTPN